jgi:hypothetical protein
MQLLNDCDVVSPQKRVTHPGLRALSAIVDAECDAASAQTGQLESSCFSMMLPATGDGERDERRRCGRRSPSVTSNIKNRAASK